MVSAHTIARLVGLLLAASGSGVHAGSRIFEPPLDTIRGVADGQLEVQRNAVSGALDFVAVVDNTTTGHAHRGLQKRYFIMDPAKDSTVKLWPNGIIKACFEQKAHIPPGGSDYLSTEQILRPTLEEAMELWRTRGLNWDKNMFKFDFAKDDSNLCVDSEENRLNRHNYLVIRFDPEGKIMDSSVGMQGKASHDVLNKKKNWFDLGPRMTLSMSGDRGGGQWVTAFAHELGHTLGLYHEQQNPAWWRFETYGGDIVDDDKPGFGPHTFICSELHDYDKLNATITAAAEKDEGPNFSRPRRDLRIREACTQIDMARAYGFSASAYLPEFQQALSNPRRTEPDYKSIMIYPSRMNGKKLPGNSKRNIVFKRWDGGEIQYNLAPSLDDIEAIRKLYNVREMTADERGKLWLGDRTSAFKSKFDKVFKKGNC